MLFSYFVENRWNITEKTFKAILNWQVSLHTENVKILKWYNQKVVYDERKEHTNGNSLN